MWFARTLLSTRFKQCSVTRMQTCFVAMLCCGLERYCHTSGIPSSNMLELSSLPCSREKVRPKDELQRAEQVIERSKEIIRQVGYGQARCPPRARCSHCVAYCDSCLSKFPAVIAASVLGYCTQLAVHLPAYAHCAVLIPSLHPNLQTVRWVSEVPADEVIPEHAHDSEGEVDVSDIFCATCKETHSTDDNDLVLCDGLCNRWACHVCQHLSKAILPLARHFVRACTWRGWCATGMSCSG